MLLDASDLEALLEVNTDLELFFVLSVLFQIQENINLFCQTRDNILKIMNE